MDSFHAGLYDGCCVIGNGCIMNGASQVARYIAGCSIMPTKLWVPASLYGIVKRRAVRTLRMAVRSSSLRLPVIGVKPAAALVKSV